MRNWWWAGGWGCLCLVACSGRVIESKPQGPAGGASTGASGAGATAAGASSSGAGSGQPDAGAACLGDGYMSCAAGCGESFADPVVGECVDGSWRCPAGLVDPMTCPVESCVRQGVRCCDHTFGRTSVPDCGSDGLYAACPPGFERNAFICVADSAQTVNCGTLEGKSCSLEEAQCEAQGAHCQCVRDDKGLLWRCAYDLL